MSESQSPQFDRHHQWRRWQMDELIRPAGPGDNQAPTSTSTYQRKIDAAQKAAKQAQQREAEARQAEYDKLRQQAEEEGYQAGLARGHEEGLAKGLEEGRQQAQQELVQQTKDTLTPLGMLAKQFSEALTQIDDTIAHDLVELATETGKQLAAEALHETPERILTLVRELLHTEPPLVGQQRLWLNPDDHALVAEHLGAELEAANWKLQPDDQLARGGCRVTSAQGELDATFESRWQAVQAQARKRQSSSSKPSAS
ncbi:MULTISPECIES: flagellar assembly protein FliH [unclassified Halomonas]|uniref:flagellar assembly protein FliH n=1 Tax=unclassified Halomonas TaxID=2609666 RepID=UPI0006DAEBF0|nr:MULTISPECIES: flagellar assembly protein FliH [unclassified Halomonas]KPQ22314.1 MAG: flagellar assembly protein FliH [Halomonas sp. HL-93]SBR52353.1 flagellar assembly protein FliH [Halomonas sp. HL-93]SNY98051.1 flagellar assembly protein FliH [Halomonas sp. hl-4]